MSPNTVAIAILTGSAGCDALRISFSTSFLLLLEVNVRESKSIGMLNSGFLRMSIKASKAPSVLIPPKASTHH